MAVFSICWIPCAVLIVGRTHGVSFASLWGFLRGEYPLKGNLYTLGTFYVLQTKDEWGRPGPYGIHGPHRATPNICIWCLCFNHFIQTESGCLGDKCGFNRYILYRNILCLGLKMTRWCQFVTIGWQRNWHPMVHGVIFFVFSSLFSFRKWQWLWILSLGGANETFLSRLIRNIFFICSFNLRVRKYFSQLMTDMTSSTILNSRAI